MNALTETGYVAGTSERYSGNQRGNSAWLYNANDHSTTRLGFFDATHTSSIGIQDSFVYQLSESGYAAGTSYRFNAAGGVGRSAWRYDANTQTTTRLGFFDAEYTRNDGVQDSNTIRLSESGYVVGTSQRFGGAQDLGRSTWLYDPSDASTTRLGVFDADHTSSEGYQSSQVLRITDSGFVTGNSSRWSSATGDYLGEEAWIFDASDGSQDSILLSVRSDGYVDSYVDFIGEDGLALGAYQLFDVDDSELGYRAFVWTPEGGALDLGALVAGLSAQGWERLAYSILENGLDMILGSGRLESGGDLAYLLLPIPVPEPGTGSLVAAGLFALVALRKLRLNA